MNNLEELAKRADVMGLKITEYIEANYACEKEVIIMGLLDSAVRFTKAMKLEQGTTNLESTSNELTIETTNELIIALTKIRDAEIESMFEQRRESKH